MTRSTPLLTLLRAVATIVLAAVVAQAGWAAAFLGGQSQFRATHSWWGTVTLAVGWAAAAAFLALRRHVGVVPVAFSVLLALALTAQVVLGESHVVSAHIFLGVVIAMLATALTSWTFRPGTAADVRRRELDPRVG